MAVRMTTPVTIVSGFLGSGKTTLINRILTEHHGRRIAVIENEFGEVGVDGDFLSRGENETIVQLANGCICCTVRADLAKALENLAQEADAGHFVFDRVLVEMSGLADPGPVIQTFLAETRIEERFHIDGVITLVDALFFDRHKDRAECRSQIAYADRLIVSKTDEAGRDAADGLRPVLQARNARAPVVFCDVRNHDIDVLLESIFNIGGFALDYVPRDEIEQIRRAAEADHDPCPGDEGCECREHHHHDALTTATSCSFVSETPLDLDRLNRVLDETIAREGARLWRCKGVVQANGHAGRLVVQGVNSLVHINRGAIWRRFENRTTALVFIGEDLDRAAILAGLKQCEMQAEGVVPG